MSEQWEDSKGMGKKSNTNLPPKHGARSPPRNWRLISLQPTIYKMFEAVLARRVATLGPGGRKDFTNAKEMSSNGGICGAQLHSAELVGRPHEKEKECEVPMVRPHMLLVQFPRASYGRCCSLLESLVGYYLPVHRVRRPCRGNWMQ